MLLRARPGLPPLEEHDPVRAARDGLIAAEAHHTGTFDCVTLPPVHLGGGLFHQHPWTALTHRADQVTDDAGLHHPVGSGGIGVAVVGDQVLVLREFKVVHVFVESHKVGGDGDIRRDLFQDYFLLFEASQPGVRAKARPVELLGRIDGRR